MNYKEINQLIKNDGELIMEILQNGKFPVGKLHFYPGKLCKAIYNLLDNGEIKMFGKDIDDKEIFEKLKELSPDNDEIELIKAVLIKKDSNLTNLSDDEVRQIGLNSFRNASYKELRKRLISKYIRWLIPVMLRNFEVQIDAAFVQILSTAQIRAENEIRDELGLSKIKPDAMRDFVHKPVKNTQNILLDIKQGGYQGRKTEPWDNEQKIAFYKKVINLPTIEGKPMWDYAYEKLVKEKFDYRVVENLRKWTDFRDVPESLYGEAVRVWNNSIRLEKKLSDENSPNGFARRYARFLLGFPEKKLSTLYKYFLRGKALSE